MLSTNKMEIKNIFFPSIGKEPQILAPKMALYFFFK